MTLRPFPAESRIRWRRLDVPGREEARVSRTANGWRLSGELEVEEAGVAARLGYVIDCDLEWRTRSAVVEGETGGGPFRFALAADGAGRWTRDGTPASDLAGALDIDLGFTPATNTLPIRRLALAVGGSAPVRSAWLRFPELRLEPLEQTYTREADQRFRYRALVDGQPFVARLDTDAFGRVLRYEGLWEADFASADDASRKQMARLDNAVAVVTGASRGAGRGIALELGAAGATVYVTGRSVDGRPTTDNVPGTIDESAREVTRRGGHGIAVRCDHTIDREVEAVFERIRHDHGRLDILVNNVWGGYENSECRPLPRVPFWEQSLAQWDSMFVAGVRAHLVASRLAVPLMLPLRRGVIVSTTANLEPLPYMRNLFYDLAKNAVARLVWALSQELREHGIAALAVAPGFMRTERVVEAFRRAGAIEALDGPGGPRETPVYLGRAVLSLTTDARVMEKSGQLVEVGALAQEYGFTDIDGAQPSPFRLPAKTSRGDPRT
jgi:NAD(P)-dependent dehydrogenase (short-subunit alcohol dehydrogenase family)